MEKVKELIVKAGGLTFIENQVGIMHFKYYVAGEIFCTPRKAEEYIQILRRSAIARARIEELTKKK